MKKLIVTATTLIVVAFGFTACLGDGSEGKYGNIYSPAVVEYNWEVNKLFLRTFYGSFVPDNASALSLMALDDGSCIVALFDYNSEYQTEDYLVASNVRHEQVGVDYIQTEDENMINTYTYPLSSVELFNESLSLNYKGKFFVSTNAKLAKNQDLNYYLYVKSGEEPDETGARNIYLQALLPGTPSSGAPDVTTARALEMRSLFYTSGTDTTINENGVNYSLKYLKMNLKYCSGIENEAPVFKSATDQPFFIFAFKDDL
jgi:hypothetical protein